MNLNVSGHHLEITPAIRTYVSEKLGRVTRHFDHVIDVHVILSVDKLRQKYAPKVAQLEERKRRAEQALQRQTEQSRASKLDTALSVGSAIFGSLFGSKGSLITKAGTASRSFSRASRESSDVDRANADLAAIAEQMAELESALQSDIAQLTAVAEAAAEQLETVVVKPKKTNISVQLVALAWEPES